MAFSFGPIVLFLISAFSIIELYTDKAEWVRILISSIGLVIGIIPITISSFVLIKQKSSRLVTIKREIYKFVYGDLFDELNAKWTHLGKGFFCNQAMVEPTVMNKINIYIPSEHPDCREEYNGVEGIYVRYNHICNLSCNHLLVNRQNSKFRCLVNSLIFINRLKGNGRVCSGKEIIGINLVGLIKNDLIVEGGVKLSYKSNISIEGKFDINENECYIRFFRNHIKVDLFHKKTSVKTRIIDDKCDRGKLFEFIKMLIRHSRNLSTGYCLDSEYIRRGVNVLHSISYQDFFYDKFKLNFSSRYIENDIIVEGLSIDEEIKDFYIIEYYMKSFVGKFGETLSKVLFAHNKDFWGGSYNFNALDYIFRRTSARFYRLIGQNYKSKRYLIDVSLFLEKSGLPRFTHLDLKVRNTRLGFEYCNYLPKDVARTEGKTIKVAIIDYNIEKAEQDEKIVKENNKTKSGTQKTHNKSHKNLKSKQKDDDKMREDNVENYNIEVLNRVEEFKEKLRVDINNLDSRINLLKVSNDDRIKLRRLLTRKEKMENKLKAVEKLNSKTIFNYLSGYKKIKSNYYKEQQSKSEISIVTFDEIKSRESSSRKKEQDYANYNSILEINRKEVDRTNEILSRKNVETRNVEVCKSLDYVNLISVKYDNEPGRKEILNKINKVSFGDINEKLKVVTLEQEVNKWKLVDDFRNLKCKYKYPDYKPESSILANNYYKVLCNLDVTKGISLVENNKKPCVINKGKHDELRKHSFLKPINKKASGKFILNNTTLGNLKDVKFTPRKKRKIVERLIAGKKCGLGPEFQIETFDVGSLHLLKDKLEEDLTPFMNNKNIGKVFKKVTIEDKLLVFKEKMGVKQYKKMLKVIEAYSADKKNNPRKYNVKMTGVKRFNEDSTISNDPKLLKLSCRGTKLNVNKYKIRNKEGLKLIEDFKKFKEGNKRHPKHKKVFKVYGPAGREAEMEAESKRSLAALMERSGCRIIDNN